MDKNHLSWSIMNQQNTDVLVIGGANIDIKWQAHHKIYEGSSSSADKSEHYGGVARNIAEGLARLGVSCRFVSQVGDDEQGHRMISDLRKLSVNTNLVSFSKQHKTASYCAFFHPSGDLHTALLDLRIYDACTKDFFAKKLPYMGESKVVVLDTDLPGESLTYLAKQLEGKIWIALTSVPAAQKLLPLVKHIDTLFLNHQEMSALCPAGYNVAQKFAWLHEQGVATVVVSHGKQGAEISSNGSVIHAPALPTSVVEVTGAGDSLIAGFLAAHIRGLSLADSLRVGMRAAHLTLLTKESVSPDLGQLFLV